MAIPKECRVSENEECRRALRLDLRGLHLAIAIGGAVGAWLAGTVFDATRSDSLSFMVAAIAALVAIAAVSLARLARVWR